MNWFAFLSRVLSAAQVRLDPAGGVVELAQDGIVWTRGFRAYGVFAQSVGGSGGDGGNATAISLNVNTDISSTVAIGGDGGAGGRGEAVSVGSLGTVITEGAHSVGILAQSVGGSGGTGGDSTTVSVDLGFPMSPEDLMPAPSLSFDVSIGGDGGAGGVAGDVTVAGSGTVVTAAAPVAMRGPSRSTSAPTRPTSCRSWT